METDAEVGDSDIPIGDPETIADRIED